jgi:hypothetical protein
MAVVRWVKAEARLLQARLSNSPSLAGARAYHMLYTHPGTLRTVGQHARAHEILAKSYRKNVQEKSHDLAAALQWTEYHGVERGSAVTRRQKERTVSALSGKDITPDITPGQLATIQAHPKAAPAVTYGKNLLRQAKTLEQQEAKLLRSYSEGL